MKSKHLKRQTHTHTRARTFTQLKARTQGQRRGKAEVEAGSSYSPKSSLPHSSHLLHRGDISCSGPNLAPKWRVPRRSNTGVCAVSGALNQHFSTACRATLQCAQGSMPDTLCRSCVGFFFFWFIKGCYKSNWSTCYTLLQTSSAPPRLWSIWYTGSPRCFL